MRITGWLEQAAVEHLSLTRLTWLPPIFVHLEPRSQTAFRCQCPATASHSSRHGRLCSRVGATGWLMVACSHCWPAAGNYLWRQSGSFHFALALTSPVTPMKVGLHFDRRRFDAFFWACAQPRGTKQENLAYRKKSHSADTASISGWEAKNVPQIHLLMTWFRLETKEKMIIDTRFI